MKKLILSLCVALAAFAARAQVERIDIDVFGNYELTVKVGNGQYVIVDAYGQLLYVDIVGNWSYYDDFWPYQAGKVKKIGDVGFEYNNDFWDYKAGKLKKIGAISFDYHNDFWDYKAGKLEKVGGTKIAYHNDFREERAGKISELGNIKIDYYTSFDFRADETYMGLLKSISGREYRYNRMSPGIASGSQGHPRDAAGRAQQERYRGTAVHSGPGRPPRPSGPAHRPHRPQHPPIPVSPNIGVSGERRFKVGNIQVVVHDNLY